MNQQNQTKLKQQRSPIDKLRRWLAEGNWLVLDTETTGLEARDEIVEIATVDPDERVFESLVRPTCPVSPAALQLHGIGPEQVATAPTFAELAPRLRKMLSKKSILGYNAAFDRRMLWNGFQQAAQPAPSCRWYCLSELVTQLCGSRLSLSQALKHYCVERQGPSHRAASDARATLDLARAILAREAGSPNRELGDNQPGRQSVLPSEP